MFIADLFESYIAEDGLQLVVLYPGRFQPFHLGHGEVFRSLQSKFGRDSVYIATSNKVEPPKSPFNFSDKTVFMNAAGVPSDRIIEVTNPYKLPEPQFNPANTIFIAAVGAPDRDRLRPDSVKKDGNPGYFKTFESLDKCTTADKHGYVIIADEREKLITLNGQPVDVSHGTPARAAWNAVRDNSKLRSEYLLQMYGRDDAELGRVLDKIPQTVNEEAGGVGVVASKKQAQDPRYSMSLTKDIRPGEVGRQLKKMHLADSVQKLHEQIADLKEKWSAKYKRSINCNSPQGFSQRAHCQGRKK
jgi:cytidyltransferase-like protein